MPAGNPSWPQHDEIGRFTRAVEAVSIVVAWTLVAGHLGRFATMPGIAHWWLLVAVLAAALAARLVSGLVHWVARTRGRETLAVLGRRPLPPFRGPHGHPGRFPPGQFIRT